MKRLFGQSLYSLKLLLVASFLASLLAGCGTLALDESYPLESIDTSGLGTSYVYRAAGKSVPDVADELAGQRTPDQRSEPDTERMFLVYSDELIHLQRDPEQSEDTLIEVDSKEYVRNNYSPGFLEGYILASLIGDLFDSSRGHGDYRGYTNRDIHKPAGEYRKPTATEKKAIPPMTVNRKGTIFKRDPAAKQTPTVGDGGRWFERTPKSSGKVIRGSDSTDSKTKSSPFFSPKKSKPPKTRIGGVGRVMRRGFR